MEPRRDVTLNKNAFSVARLDDADDDVAYWLTRTPRERIAAVETLRQVLYGHRRTSARLQRVLTVARLEER